MKDTLVVNMSDLEVKRRLMSKIGALSGLWEFDMKPRRRTRNLNQNAYYFAAVVTPFLEWLREQCGDPGITAEQAHEALKKRILGVAHDVNGIEIIPASKTLDVAEFGLYIDNCAAFLAEFCEIVVLPSEMFFEEKGKKSNERRLDKAA